MWGQRPDGSVHLYRIARWTADPLGSQIHGRIGHLRQRYLWAPAVDELLGEEAVDGGTADLVQWTLTEHLSTVRDIAHSETVRRPRRSPSSGAGRLTSKGQWPQVYKTPYAPVSVQRRVDALPQREMSQGAGPL